MSEVNTGLMRGLNPYANHAGEDASVMSKMTTNLQALDKETLINEIEVLRTSLDDVGKLHDDLREVHDNMAYELKRMRRKYEDESADNARADEYIEELHDLIGSITSSIELLYQQQKVRGEHVSAIMLYGLFRRIEDRFKMIERSEIPF